MSAISIKIKSLKSLQKQVAFAVRLTLNDAAFAVRSRLVDSVSQHFAKRNTWTERGMRVVKAVKRGMNAGRAIVGTIRDYMRDHVTGGRRTGRNAIPAKKMRRNNARIIRKGRWPGALRGPRVFAIDTQSGRLPSGSRGLAGGRGLTVYRRGRGKRRRPIKLWFLPRSQKVKKRWPFLEIVTRIFNASLVAPVFQRHLRRALATAR